MCRHCGYEVCVRCYGIDTDTGRDNSQILKGKFLAGGFQNDLTNYLSVDHVDSSPDCYSNSFLPISRLALCEIKEDLETAREVEGQKLVNRGPCSGVRAALLAAKDLNEIPILDPGQISKFESLWAAHLPLVVRKVDLQVDWSPDSFTNKHGDMAVTMLCSQGLVEKERKVKLSEFFTALHKSNQDELTVVKIRVSRCIILALIDGLNRASHGRIFHLRRTLKKFWVFTIKTFRTRCRCLSSQDEEDGAT